MQSAGQPPLYTVAQAQSAMKLLQPAAYGQTIQPAERIKVCFHDAGHILGSAWLEVTVSGEGRPRKLVFSGDLGMVDRPVLRDPEKVIPEADLLLIESTYGDRLHRSFEETEEEIIAAIERTRATHGNLIIPSFAVGRTQEIVFILADLVRSGRLGPLKVYVDSPMSNTASRITEGHPELLDDHTRVLIAWLAAHPKKMKIDYVADVEHSKALNEIRRGAVIISASGMCEAGRIKYHLRENLLRSECSILIAGFQAAGTLGRRLVDGAKLVRIFGEQVPVRARIYTVGGLSAHADQATLLSWLRGFRKPPGHVFVVHGEAGASASFATAIGEQLGWTQVHLPRLGEYVTL
jgi:metallo-beta-lactamase family protein